MSHHETRLDAQPSLFEPPDGDDGSSPLAERLRPRTLDEVAGQRHLIGEGKVLRGIDPLMKGANLCLRGGGVQPRFCEEHFLFPDIRRRV